MKKNNLKVTTPSEAEAKFPELAALRSMPDNAIDTSDSPYDAHDPTAIIETFEGAFCGPLAEFIEERTEMKSVSIEKLDDEYTEFDFHYCKNCGEVIAWDDYSYVHLGGWADCGVDVIPERKLVLSKPIKGWKGKRKAKMMDTGRGEIWHIKALNGFVAQPLDSHPIPKETTLIQAWSLQPINLKEIT